MLFFRTTSVVGYSGLLIVGQLVACQPQLTLQPLQAPVKVAKTDVRRSSVLPAYIDHHAEGGLAHLVHRSTFEYNEKDQLQSIKDGLISPSPTAQLSTAVTTRAQFYYTNDRVTKISLSIISTDYDPVGSHHVRPAIFELTYEGQTVNARLMLDNQEVKKSSFQLDQAGYPLKSNVSYGQLLLDSQGHLDYVAESKRNKTKNPDNFIEVLDQQYDQNQNVFAESKEYQILTALLATFNCDMLAITGLEGLDNALTNNNLRYRTVRHHSLYGYTGTLVSETQSVNSLGFPTQRSAPIGAMGIFFYTITYK